LNTIKDSQGQNRL